MQQVEEMTQLTTQLNEAFTTLQTATGPVSYPLAAWGDFSLLKTYRLLPAEALYKTFHLRANFALLNKGAKDSLYPGLAVVSPRGIIGIIADTTAHTSIMYALFHKDIHVTAILTSQQVFGLTSWKKPVLNRLQLEYIPLYVSVQPGDEVWTAPNSALFPSGLRIGRVTRVETDFTQGFHAIEIATFSDWQRNEPLFVLVPRHP
ncbi:MAG: rod shape-determining protein MreC [Bacteroidia bacterium]|jgi:rod shape-determining protein MreC|nr:rod shape-determining protein MreC [Bacteroidia bacterium]